MVSCGTKGTMAGVLVTVPSNGISGGGGHRGPKTKYQWCDDTLNEVISRPGSNSHNNYLDLQYRMNNIAPEHQRMKLNSIQN